MRRGGQPFVIVCAFLLAGSVCAQIPRPNQVVNVLGQVYAPGGGPVQQSVRVNFESEDGRPPEIVYTDSNGRFVLYSLVQGQQYSVRVDSDDRNWGTTIARFIPMGRNATVQVYLRHLDGKPSMTGSPVVSAYALRNDVPRPARRQFEKAMQEMAQGNARATQKLERAIELYPHFVEARNELAVILMRDGQLALAEQHLRRAVESDGTAALPLMNLGLCLYRQQRYGEAALPLEKSLQVQPSSHRAMLLLGITWVMAGDDPRAENVLQRAYELGGARAARSQYYLAHFYTRRKDYPRAAAALENYLRDAPNDPAAPELAKTLSRLRATITQN
jgi:Flp pilus assembly protein TadD